MARFRLSTDILSPLNSDISLNDGSAFSFGSLPGTPPVFDSNFASPINCAETKDTDIDTLCARNMKEYISTFGEITNDIKKQASINTEKEEKYKETYEGLKKSMDDLFGKNFDSLSSSPQFKNDESKSENPKIKMHSKMNAVDQLMNFENPKFLNKCVNSENISETTTKKSEKFKEEKSATNKIKNNQKQPKRTASVSELAKDIKNKYVVHVKSDNAVNDKKALINQKKNSKTLSRKNGASFDNKGTSCTILPEKKEIQNSDAASEKKDALIDQKKKSKTLSRKDGTSRMASNILFEKNKKQKNITTSEKEDSSVDQKKSTKTSSGKEETSFDNKGMTSKVLPKNNEKQNDIKKYDFKCQKKITVPIEKPVIEHKSLSVEKSIQLAVSLEMDNIRRFVLDQNLSMQKDLLKLQEVFEKQNEVTNYLFNVIDELMDTNKKLISKCE